MWRLMPSRSSGQSRIARSAETIGFNVCRLVGSPTSPLPLLGVRVRGELSGGAGASPMCGGTTWEFEDWRPFTRLMEDVTAELHPSRNPAL